MKYIIALPNQGDYTARLMRWLTHKGHAASMPLPPGRNAHINGRDTGADPLAKVALVDLLIRFESAEANDRLVRSLALPMAWPDRDMFLAWLERKGYAVNVCVSGFFVDGKLLSGDSPDDVRALLPLAKLWMEYCAL